MNEVAARFAARGVDRFGGGTRWTAGAGGEPLLDGAAVRLRCDWHTVQGLGDHLLVVGRVIGVEIGAVEHPLLYHRGRFGRFAA